MKKRQGPGAKKGGSTGDDDHEVWHYAAATIEPLKRAKGRFHPASEAVKLGHVKPKAPARVERVTGKHRADAAPVEAPAVKPSRTTAPELALFDRNSVRKIRGGRLDIEARVDLHGMRQHEAHAALRRFLLSCQARGLRYVLIITGKGKALGSQASHIGEADRERGVLKRNVPRWLEEPDLRAIVVSFTTAAIQHGGEGAIYVHLRARHRV
ncbi:MULTISPECIES: Smr/MutS family protein [unclassified Hyphomicrobium]|uniref:Smr/MutS family protein n=1 Tax=unclassified Hyphomicrobium TaxID=2619925 RepID=UPI000213E94A|nr:MULTISPECIES: Smr/MutS family protein [unclassified Hyphomicrobium]CCB67777.1 Smr protein/MutS2 [Hyphomicrobium sp. MC1]